MADSRIVKYINDTLSKGFSEGDVKVALKKQGWNDDEISEAIKAAKSGSPVGKPPEGKPEDKKPEQVAKQQPGNKSIMKGGFILTVAGGAIIILNSILVYFGIGDMLELFVSNIGISFLSMFDVRLSNLDTFLINLIIGGFLMGSSYIIYAMSDKGRITSVFIIILSMISVVIGNGFLIGGIIAITGGIFAFLKK